MHSQPAILITYEHSELIEMEKLMTRDIPRGNALCRSDSDCRILHWNDSLMNSKAHQWSPSESERSIK